MSTCKGILLLLTGTAMMFGLPISAEQVSSSWGQELDDQELTQLNVNIRTNGVGLPEGHGTAKIGRSLFEQTCATCHGPTGIEGPAPRMAGEPGPLNLANPFMGLSVGGMWPYATSIFDYVYRAMPPYAPKTLSDDEVYALTAYILQLNGLVDEDSVIDATSLPLVEMPALHKAKSGWPDWTPPNMSE